MRSTPALRSFLGLCSVLAVLWGPWHAPLARGLEVRTLDGEKSTLAAHIAAGHFTYVMVWTTYCGYCKRDYAALSRFHARHHGKDAEVLGISVDGQAAADKVRAFVAAGHFDFPTVMAEPEAMSVAFEAASGERFTGTPSYLVFAPDRTLAAVHSGNLDESALEAFLLRHSEHTPSPAGARTP
jgi:thiol-disulfide isomerase/thioredoxin